MTITPETVLFGKYRILGELSQGGMGAVYRALDLGLGVERAVKVIRADQSHDPIATEFFLREGQALLDVQHEAVVRCHELLRDDQNRFYLVMELIHGPNLSDVIGECALAVPAVHALLHRLGPGLAAAHACGVIHRDIASDNVVLPDSRPELAKLIDFGLAKLVATGEETIQEGFKGRLAYASPEQFGLFGGRIDQRSDIYSLGVVLAEAASGERIFARQSFIGAVDARRRVPELPETITPGLRSLIEWMLSPDPRDRPETVGVLLGSATALDQIEERSPAVGPIRLRPVTRTSPPPVAVVERRQVTALYCDIVNSRSLSSSLDLEDYHEVLREYQEACATALERYDAEVARHAGSAIVVYFGYPRAHEDDPQRAILAGLDILSLLRQRHFGSGNGLDLQLTARVGIHTGPVVVGGVGGRDSTSRQVLGHTVNLAAGLQGVAEADTVTVSAATLALTRGMFPQTDRGPLRLADIEETVHAHTILSGGTIRDHVGAAAESGATPLVARESDLLRLEETWKNVVDGRGHAFLLSGDAGVGKSRLVRAFRERRSSEPHAWIECFCSPFATNSPLYPVLGLVGQLVRLDRERGAAGERHDLLAELERPSADSSDWRPLFRKLLTLVDAGDAPQDESPERLRRRTLEAIADWTLSFAARQPTVLVVEDLHWSDPSTREFLSLLLRRLGSTSLLCLVTHRPEFVDPWRDSESVTSHTVGRLSATEAEALVERMREGSALSAAARREIAIRADGVPLFVEELVKAAASGHVSSDPAGLPSIPASLQSSLLARLDRLGGAKRVAQLASTLGRDFPYRLLVAIVDEPESRLRSSLTELVRADILCWSGESPNADLCFKHALLQDAAYSSLLRRHRRDAHRRVARTIEQVCPDRIRQQPEILAHHLLEGGERLGAANAYRTAGRRAVSEAAYEEALGHYTHGLDALNGCTESVERDRAELALRILLGNAIMATRGYGAPEIITVWDRAAEIGEAVEDHDEWSSAVNGAAVYAMQTGDCRTAVQRATKMLTVAESQSSRIAALRGHGTLAQAHFYLGEGESALAHAEHSLLRYEPGDFELVTYGIGYDQAVIAHGAAALAHWWLAHYDRSMASARAAVDHASTIRSSQTMAMALSFLSFSHYLRREAEPVLETAGKVEALAAELRFPVWHALSLLLSGAVRAWHHRDPVGLEMIDRGSAMLASTNEQSGAGFALSLRADALWCVGRREEALDTAELGLAVSGAMDQPYFTPELLRLKGEFLLATAPEEGERVIGESLADATVRGAHAFELRSATSLARVWLQQGRPDEEARELLAPILARTTEGQGTHDVETARMLFATIDRTAV